ncbi:MAG TPA: amidohydrolase family protein [Actinomycetota bacterium]|nr:amidohydrolase family protein [Actinomycetota bacterium]
MLLRGMRLADGTGRDPVADATVEIEGGRIVRVGGPSVSGGEVDCTGLTLVPGLIDAHSHLGLVDLAGQEAMPAAVVAAKIFRVCGLALDAGFTTVRDAGGVDGGLAHATESGLVRGPRIFPSGPVLCQSGGHGDLRPPFGHHHHVPGIPGLAQMSQVVDGPDEVRWAAREAFRRGATQIKVCVSGGVVSLSDDLEDTQLSVDELRAAVEEAEARQTYVMAHAHNVRGIRNGLAAGVRSFEHATFLDEPTATQVAAAGAWVVPTLAVTHLLADEWEQWGLPPEAAERVAGIEEAMSHAVKLAADAGVKIGSGSDLLGPEQNRRGLELLLKSRILDPMRALVSATSVNAEIIGMTDELGTVTEGKRADLVAFDGDPLSDPELFDDPSRVVLVIQGGRIVKDTRS